MLLLTSSDYSQTTVELKRPKQLIQSLSLFLSLPLLFSQFISGHFDTQNAGAKQEASSYRKILQDELKTAPENVLFFTDIPKGRPDLDYFTSYYDVHKGL